MVSTDDPTNSIRAAWLAVHDSEYETAEDALLESLSRVRRRKAEARRNDAGD
jgi:hypothetical protein